MKEIEIKFYGEELYAPQAAKVNCKAFQALTDAARTRAATDNRYTLNWKMLRTG